MAYFETINELKNSFMEDQQITKETYLEAEANLVDAIGEYINGADVHCNAYGNGKVTAFAGDTLENLVVEIAFAEVTKKFSLMAIMKNSFVKFADIAEIGDAWDEAVVVHTNLVTGYKEYVAAQAQAQYKAKKDAEKEKEAEAKYQKRKEQDIKSFENLLNKAKEFATHTDELYFAIGWLARHVGTIRAEIPDYLQKSFEQHFGGDVTPYVIDSKKKTSGGFALKWGVGMLARFSSKDLTPVPSILTRYLDQTGKLISNTAFVRDLVDDYGFQFGKKQDIEKITKTIPAKHIEAFTAGLES